MTDHTEALRKIRELDDAGYNSAMVGLINMDRAHVLLAYAETLDNIRAVVDEALATAEQPTDEKPEETQTSSEDEEQRESSVEDIFAALGLDQFLPLIDRLGKGLRSDTSIKEDSAQPKKASDPLGDILNGFFDGRL